MSSPETQIRLAVVAPLRAMRVGISAMLAGDENLRVVEDAASLEELSAQAVKLDVILVSGLTFSQLFLSRALLHEQEAPALVVLAEEPLSPPLPDWFQVHPWSILPADSKPEELILAVRAAAAGFWLADPALTSALIIPPNGTSMRGPGEPDELLTAREIEVLQQLAQGLANKQIAAALHVSENTVKFHISAIYTKLGAGNRAEAVRLGIRLGYITV